jgi:hypothetical protein
MIDPSSHCLWATVAPATVVVTVVVSVDVCVLVTVVGSVVVVVVATVVVTVVVTTDGGARGAPGRLRPALSRACAGAVGPKVSAATPAQVPIAMATAAAAHPTRRPIDPGRSGSGGPTVALDRSDPSRIPERYTMIGLRDQCNGIVGGGGQLAGAMAVVPSAQLVCVATGPTTVVVTAVVTVAVCVSVTVGVVSVTVAVLVCVAVTVAVEGAGMAGVLDPAGGAVSAVLVSGGLVGGALGGVVPVTSAE